MLGLMHNDLMSLNYSWLCTGETDLWETAQPSLWFKLGEFECFSFCFNRVLGLEKQILVERDF